MKKVTGILMASTLAISMALTSISCTSNEAATPTETTPPVTATPSQTAAQNIAEEFIKNSATFKFDGVAGSIKLKQDLTPTLSTIGRSAFIFEYQTTHAGHGDRTGQVLAQVITTHSVRIEVIDAQKKVDAAICDETWNMVTDKAVYNNEEITDAEAQAIAIEFLKGTATFKFDGIADSIKYSKSEPGPTDSFMSTLITFIFQTGHPGHGDRSGEYLAQVVTNHTTVLMVNIEKGTVVSAVCDETWDLINNKDLPVVVTGVVLSGGDTAQPDGPMDVPHKFVYTIQKADGTQVNVSYMAYPPSPVGDEYKTKVTLSFYDGGIKIGDKLEAFGTLEKGTNTIVMANQGDYIKTSPAQP